MKNSNMNLISNFNINKGSFNLNNHHFIIEDSYVKTNGSIDPLIKFKATTNYKDDEISIIMDGKLADKDIKFTSTVW